MRITRQLLRSRSKRPLNRVRYVDLSNTNIVTLDNVNLCPKLTTLVARNNNIDSVNNLDCCPELWKIDFAHNKLQNLNGFSRFSALGCLVISNNFLGWNNLQNISHIHILQLSLHGNPKLEKDPYYRMHVIDSLPYVWMLDGKLITSAERQQVDVFFKASELSDRPVRHKSPKKRFTPTLMKNLPVTGVFGEKTVHWMKRFPLHEKPSEDLDKRRLRYLAYNLTEDLRLQSEYVNTSERFGDDLLLTVLDQRDNDKEKSNMLLLVLVAFIEFRIPQDIIQQTLHIAHLNKTGSYNTIALFQFSKDIQCRIACLLLSGVKIDRDAKVEDGFYDRLYLCLYDLVSEWHKLSNGNNVTRNPGPRTVLAAEVVQLFCIVPAFLIIVGNDPGLLELVSCATQDLDIAAQLSAILRKGYSNSGNSNEVFQEIGFYIMHKVQKKCPRVVRSRGKIIPTRICSPCLQTSNYNSDVVGVNVLCQERAKSAVYIRNENDEMFNRVTPNRKPFGKKSARSAFRHVALGDKVVTEDKDSNIVVALPEKNIAVVHKEMMTGRAYMCSNKIDDVDNQFSYIDTETLKWNPQQGYWYIKENKQAIGMRDKGVERKPKSLDACSGAFVTEVVKKQLPVELWMSVTPLEITPKTENGVSTSSKKGAVTAHVRELVKECIKEANMTVDEKPKNHEVKLTPAIKNNVKFAEIDPTPSEAILNFHREENTEETPRNWEDLSDDDMITKNETDRVEAWRYYHLRNLEERIVTTKNKFSSVTQPPSCDINRGSNIRPLEQRSFSPKDVYTSSGKRLSYPLPGWMEELHSNTQRKSPQRASTARRPCEPEIKECWTPIITRAPVTRYSPSVTRERGNHFDNDHEITRILHTKRHQSAGAVEKNQNR